MKNQKFKIPFFMTVLLYCSSMFALSDPTNLYLTNITKDSITLNWTDTSDDETGFKIYQNGVLIHTTDANATTYTAIGLKSDVEYTYKVTAVIEQEDPSNVWISSNENIIANMIYAYSDSQTLYIESNTGSNYKTNNAGLTWEISSADEINNLPWTITMNDIREISTEDQIPEEYGAKISYAEDIVLDGNGSYYVATYYNVYKISSEGNWTKLNPNPMDPFSSTPCALLYDNGSLYVGTYWNGVFKYQNGNWTHMSDGLPEGRGINGIQKTTDGTLYAVGHDQLGGTGIYKFKKTDNKWFPVNYNLDSFEVYGTWHIVINSNDEIFINTPYFGIYKKNRKGWFNILPSNGVIAPSQVSKILVDSNNTIYILCGDIGANPNDGIGVYKSADHGKSWQAYGDGLLSLEKTPFKTLDITLDNNDTLYLCDYSGRFYLRSKKSKRWKKFFQDNGTFGIHGSPRKLIVDNVDSNIYFSSNYNGIYQGSTIQHFRPINTGIAQEGEIVPKSLVLSGNTLYAYITIVNEVNGTYTNTSGIWQTSTDEINWQKLPDISVHVNDLMATTDNKLYIGTDQGMYIYENNDLRSFNEGLPDNLKVNTITHINHTIYIGTSEGVYYKESDLPWQHIENVGLNNIHIKTLAVSQDGYLYAGTSDGFHRFKFDNSAY